MPDAIRCLNCHRAIVADSLGEFSDGRLLWEDAEEGTLSCEAHPAPWIFEAEEEVSPHVPALTPTEKDIREAIVFACGTKYPAEEMGQIHPYGEALLLDLLARLGGAR